MISRIRKDCAERGESLIRRERTGNSRYTRVSVKGKVHEVKLDIGHQNRIGAIVAMLEWNNYDFMYTCHFRILNEIEIEIRVYLNAFKAFQPSIQYLLFILMEIFFQSLYKISIKESSLNIFNIYFKINIKLAIIIAKTYIFNINSINIVFYD